MVFAQLQAAVLYVDRDFARTRNWAKDTPRLSSHPVRRIWNDDLAHDISTAKVTVMLPNYGAVVRLLSRTKRCGFAPNMALFCGVDPVREVPKVTPSAAAAIAPAAPMCFSDILGPTKNPSR